MNKNQFLATLKAANAVIVNGSPVLREWEVSDINGSGDNQVAQFRWYEAGTPFGITLTEEGISSGRFAEGGWFICSDHDGDQATIQLFRMEALAPVAKRDSTGSTSIPQGRRRHKDASQDQLVLMDRNVPETSQEAEFINATLQGASPTVAMSIATYFTVPQHIANDGEDAIARYVLQVLVFAASKSNCLRFHVQLGQANLQ